MLSLSLELGYQDVALSELQSFIAVYPQSAYIAEAKELLVNALTNSNNYKEALVLYQSLGAQSETVKRVYPRILYGRAVELINDQQIEQADSLLNEVVKAPYNNTVMPYVYFWKGEIAYRTNNVDNAIDNLNNYLKNPVSNAEVNVTNAKYNLGYSYVQKESYNQALGMFEQITKSISANSTPIEQDAYVRSADAYFMNKNYRKASDMYDAVINANLRSADYALYQKAIIAGANNKTAEKVQLLQSLQQRYSSSGLVADANMEIANTYLADENYRGAITPLNSLVKDTKAASLHPQAYLKLGIAYFNLR